MKTAVPEEKISKGAPSGNQFHQRVSRARHDLHNSIGQILGFSEMLLEEAQEQGLDLLRAELESINRTAGQLVEQINKVLDATKTEPDLGEFEKLQQQLCEQSSQIVTTTESLKRKLRGLKDNTFKEDIARIAGAARQTLKVARTTLGFFSVPGEMPRRAVGDNPLTDLLTVRIETEPPIQPVKEGSILVVDDQAANRELLSRRLSRLGYSMQSVNSGRRALEFVVANSVDLILLDIVMPGLDGLEVLQRLKASPATQHIPVVMLSSDDKIDTVISCLKLGADDFLPKPFNATLLMARIESSLSKKRLRDQETDFLKRLQAEQATSERLLLNILPKAIAERLKQGEQNIADSFPEVTVLFSDFVDFTKFATGISPKDLVRRLNEIFSAFDQLCERHGLEKIKMIGDAYMVVGGLPTPRADHAEAMADLALAMQQEAARFNGINSAPFRMRIGINTGPVVAGVIGTKKFAYDLWGDTVNLASRMETHAPSGGILVTDSTYERLRDQYVFKAGRVIRVKGKGEVLSHLLLSKSGE